MRCRTQKGPCSEHPSDRWRRLPRLRACAETTRAGPSRARTGCRLFRYWAFAIHAAGCKHLNYFHERDLDAVWVLEQGQLKGGLGRCLGPNSCLLAADAIVKKAVATAAQGGRSALRAVDLYMLTTWNIFQTHIFLTLSFSQPRLHSPDWKSGDPPPPRILGISGLARNSRQNPDGKEVRYQNP